MGTYPFPFYQTRISFPGNLIAKLGVILPYVSTDKVGVELSEAGVAMLIITFTYALTAGKGVPYLKYVLLW